MASTIASPSPLPAERDVHARLEGCYSGARPQHYRYLTRPRRGDREASNSPWTARQVRPPVVRPASSATTSSMKREPLS